jgi:hypothetical protein
VGVGNPKDTRAPQALFERRRGVRETGPVRGVPHLGYDLKVLHRIFSVASISSSVAFIPFVDTMWICAKGSVSCQRLPCSIARFRSFRHLPVHLEAVRLWWRVASARK